VLAEGDTIKMFVGNSTMKHGLSRRKRESPLRIVFAAMTALSFVLAHSAPGPEVIPDDTEKPEFSGTVAVNLGTIYVNVLDKKNRPVTGLKPDDFVLFVNGERQEISHFAEVENETAIAKALPTETRPSEQIEWDKASTAATPPRLRLLAVVVDNDNISVFHRNHLMRRAQQFIENRVRPPHPGMLLTNERYPKVLCPPTTSAEDVLSAMERLLDTASGSMAIDHAIRFAEDKISGSGSRYDKFGGEQAVTFARMTANQIDVNLRRSVESLKTVCRGLGGFEGKKDLLYISDGLPMTPGEELFRLIDLQNPSGGGGTSGSVLNELHAFYRAPLFEELADHAIAADVTLHTIDARGLLTEHDTTADRRFEMPVTIGYVKARNYQEPLRYLSAQTGGIAVVNTNQFRKGLAQIEEAITSYYSLGFRLGARGNDRVHSIRIELPNHPDNRMRYRRQFLERSDASLVADRTMTGLLMDPLRNDLDIRLSVETVEPQTANSWIGKIALKIPSLHLAAARGTESTSVDLSVFSVSSSEKGRSPLSRTEVVVDLPSDRDAAVQLQINLELDPGFNRISIGILDEVSGMTGFAVAEQTVMD
jgi:VWFA-related protein